MEKDQYKLLLILHKPCYEYQMGQEAGFGAELMELPLLAALGVWTPKAHQGHVLGIPCTMFPLASGVFSFALINRILLSLSLWTHGLCPWSLGAQLLWVRGWSHQLAPCGFLHISAHQCVWGQCLVHNEMTFPWACKTDASRSEISWTPVSKPAGRAGVAQSLTCVTVAGSLAPCPGGKAPIPTYLIFSFLALCQIFFVLFCFKLHFVLQLKKT